MKMIRLMLTAVIFLAQLAPCSADPTVIRYIAGEKLSDVALIDRAAHEIDVAAYELRDWTIIQALMRATDRGVKVRVYLDGAQPADREPSTVIESAEAAAAFKRAFGAIYERRDPVTWC